MLFSYIIATDGRYGQMKTKRDLDWGSVMIHLQDSFITLEIPASQQRQERRADGFAGGQPSMRRSMTIFGKSVDASVRDLGLPIPPRQFPTLGGCLRLTGQEAACCRYPWPAAPSPRQTRLPPCRVSVPGGRGSPRATPSSHIRPYPCVVRSTRARM